MFNKILIAEDFQDTNRGIVDMLKNKLHIQEIQEELYCDKALNRLRLAHAQNKPYNLLITDLFFKEDHVARELTSGLELINAARSVQADLKIIVNSMVDDPAKINALFKEANIDAYVCKGRNGLTELMTAMRAVSCNSTFVSPHIRLNAIDNVLELDEFDLTILKDLADGLTKKEISEKLKQRNVTPNSESTIDKRVSKLFDEFGAKNTNHLLAKLIRKDRI